MMHYGYGFGFFPFFPIIWLVFWVFVVFMVWGRWHRGGRWEQRHNAEDILSERYVKGEIDEDEYKKRLDVLRRHAENKK